MEGDVVRTASSMSNQMEKLLSVDARRFDLGYDGGLAGDIAAAFGVLCSM